MDGAVQGEKSWAGRGTSGLSDMDDQYSERIRSYQDRTGSSDRRRTMKKEQRSGAMAFLPLEVFLGLYAGCGLIFTFMGAEEPFSQFPRHVALLFGIISIVFLAPEIRFSDKLDVFCKGMGDLGVMQIVMIYLLAGGFQGAAASMGGRIRSSTCASILSPSLCWCQVYF